MLLTTGIWLVRVDNLWVLGDTVMQVARYLLVIYSCGISEIHTFVVPLTIIEILHARKISDHEESGEQEEQLRNELQNLHDDSSHRETEEPFKSVEDS